LKDFGKEYRIYPAKGEDPREHKGRVMREIYTSEYWRPHRAEQKYGLNRRNPWHSNLDDIMFYL
jgi:hypothetical protein